MQQMSADQLLKKIKISFHRKLNTNFAGEYRSAFKGNGLQFETVREYQYGDEIKYVDWNVSARMNHLYIKEFIEERELNIVLMVDISSSMQYGTMKRKDEVLMEVITLLLFLAQYNNDRVSVMLFTDRVEWFFTPQKGRKYILKVIREIMNFKPAGSGTDISKVIDFSMTVLKKKSVIFLLSDFIDDNYLVKMKRLRRKHDVIPVRITDPTEKRFHFFGLTQFYDLESKSTVHSTSPGKPLDDEIHGFEVMNLSTDEQIESSILKYFEKRNRKRLARW
ncbi:MAG: DUF58 domain-containing protein [Spirochaetes bacterium]|nr:DUF58 domain-containing protein [Spirochaetota bacterium]